MQLDGPNERIYSNNPDRIFLSLRLRRMLLPSLQRAKGRIDLGAAQKVIVCKWHKWIQQFSQ